MDTVDHILDSVIYFEIGCALIGTFYFYKYNENTTRLILPYLWFICGVEAVGSLLITDNNQWIYNVLGIIEYSTFLYIFYHQVHDDRKKLYIKILFLLCMLAVIYDGLFISEPPFQAYLNYALSFASLSIAITCLLYLTTLVRTEKVLHLSRVLLFWISIGLLIYHCSNLPITALSNIFTKVTGDNNLLIIQALSGIIMYVCFILGFIWSNKKFNI